MLDPRWLATWHTEVHLLHPQKPKYLITANTQLPNTMAEKSAGMTGTGRRRKGSRKKSYSLLCRLRQGGGPTSAGRQANTHTPDKGKRRLAQPTGLKELPPKVFLLFHARMDSSPPNLKESIVCELLLLVLPWSAI